MAVYRSDQAQLTFGPEAAPGGYPEGAATVGGSGANGTLNQAAGFPAGSSKIVVDVDSGTFAAGADIRIGPGVSGSGTNAESEVRHIEFVEGSDPNVSLYLDAPTAFFHPDNTDVDVCTSVTTAATDIFMNQIPGGYDTVDVPDPEMTIEPRYFLGTASKRNFYAAYKGQQAFTGSIPGFVLLNGRALRFPFGKVVTTPSALLGSNVAALNGAAKKGDVYITYDGTNAGTISASAPHNILCIDDGSATLSEVRKVVSTNGTIARLDYPLQFDHADDASIARVDTAGYYTHNILETVDLDTVSWHVHMRDSSETAANDFDRRYFGGLIGSATLAADEGGMLNMSWDGVNFQGMVHNQAQGNSLSTTAAVPHSGLMQTIASTDVDFPTSNPYFFSQGSVTMFGVEVARVRSFNLTVANGEEPRYYIQRRHGQKRGPTEIRENRREYSLGVTLATADSRAAAGANPVDSATLFKEFLREGDYGSGMVGFAIVLTFTRSANDTITITIPDDGSAALGGNEQGAFMRTAQHGITGDNPVQVDADILFRNLKIEVKDSLYYYP